MAKGAVQSRKKKARKSSKEMKKKGPYWRSKTFEGHAPKKKKAAKPPFQF